MLVAAALLTILVVVVMLMLMLVAVALFTILVMVMVMLMLVAVALLTVLVVVMMLMLVAMALLAILVVVMLMLVAAALLTILVVVVMLVLVAVALLAILVVVVMLHMDLDRAAGLDHLQHHLGGQLVPGGGDHAHAGMGLLDEDAALLHAVSREQLGAAEDDGIGGLDLIEEELAEVLHVHAALARVHHGGAAGDLQLGMLSLALFHRRDDLAQLANAAGLDDQAVGIVFLDQLVHGLLEVAHQGAADAAGVQLIHDDAGILHERAVHAHVAVLVLQQDDLLSTGLDAAEQLLDQRGLARAQEAGNNVDLDHVHISISIDFISSGPVADRAPAATLYYTTFVKGGQGGDFVSFSFFRTNAKALPPGEPGHVDPIPQGRASLAR